MPCDTIRQETKEEIIQRAQNALKTGRAKLAKKAGRIVLEGLSAQERNGMQDSCILAGIARRADTLTKAKIHAAGTTPQALVSAHGHHH